MNYEYRQIQVDVRGWFKASLSDRYIADLNRLAKDGWEVDHILGLQVNMGTTTTVVFILKRELEPNK